MPPAPAFRPVVALLIAALLLPTPASAYYTPLSDQAVREAYFLGHGHDGLFVRELGKYTKPLAPPKTGPYISSIAFLTPFIQIALYNNSLVGNYSAVQAELDHRRQAEEGEFVHVVVEIQLTASYGRLMTPSLNSRTNTPNSLEPRPHDFWKDFQVGIYEGKKLLAPSASHGHANSNCGRGGKPCFLSGATLEFELPATAFTADTSTIEVTPPEGDPVSVDFYLPSLR